MLWHNFYDKSLQFQGIRPLDSATELNLPEVSPPSISKEVAQVVAIAQKKPGESQKQKLDPDGQPCPEEQEDRQTDQESVVAVTHSISENVHQ